MVGQDSAPSDPLAQVLLVEDEPSLAFNLQLNLNAEGYKVRHVLTGQDAIETWGKDGPFDLVILDVMIPDTLKDISHLKTKDRPRKDGLFVAETIRQENSVVPIIMLTALAREEDRIRGLKTGVDDYITKPFHLDEFLLKVKRCVDRSLAHKAGASLTPNYRELSLGGYTLYPEELQIKRGDFVKHLTEIETGLIAEFFKSPSTLLTRPYLLEKVWGQTGQVDTRTVDNFIRRLRLLFEEEPKTIDIESIRGRGYRMRLLNQ